MMKMVKVRTVTDQIHPIFVAISDSGHLSFLGLEKNETDTFSPLNYGSYDWQFVNYCNIPLST